MLRTGYERLLYPPESAKQCCQRYGVTTNELCIHFLVNATKGTQVCYQMTIADELLETVVFRLTRLFSE